MNKKLISLRALDSNLRYFSKQSKVIAMVKADAYGHGMKQIVSHLEGKVAYFGVASLKEAIEIRKFSSAPVLICTNCTDFNECISNNISFVSDDLRVIKKVIKSGYTNLLHIKLDCGMNRYGINADNFRQLSKLKRLTKGKTFGGLCTHFSSLENYETTMSEYYKFCTAKEYLNICAPIHFGGSSVINYNFNYDMIRVGIGLYGYPNLSPVMQISSNISHIKEVKKGESVGYSGKFTAEKDCRVAIVPLGYADGLSRKCSGYFVKIKGKPCRIIGNICMDNFFVDVSNVKCKIGEKVVVMDNAEKMAEFIETIPYEILTNFKKLRL